jgi:hypothetical protein
MTRYMAKEKAKQMTSSLTVRIINIAVTNRQTGL